MDLKKTSFVEIHQDPLHTPASVYELAIRARNEDLQGVFLHHLEEPNVVRGIRQPFSEGYSTPQVRRPDLGLSWYHYKTLCFMIAIEGNPSLQSLRKFTGYVAEFLSEFLPEHETDDIIFKKGDLYSKLSRKQIAGVSTTPKDFLCGNDFSVYRACMYTSPETRDAIAEMVVADPQVMRGEEFRVLDSFEIVSSRIIDMARDFSSQEFTSDKFLTSRSINNANEIQHRPSLQLGRKALLGSCIDGLLRT